jgi:hypothetical protein
LVVLFEEEGAGKAELMAFSMGKMPLTSVRAPPTCAGSTTGRY